MRVLLRLGDAELGVAGGGHHFAEDVAEVLRRHQHVEEAVQLLRIAHHAAGVGEADGQHPLERVEVRIDQCRHDLADAIGAEVGAQDAVAVRHAPVAFHHEGRDELVAEIARIGRPHGIFGRRRPLAHRRDDGLAGALRAIPAPVAVHGVVTADHRGEADAVEARDLAAEVGQIAEGRARRGVSPVGEGVDPHRKPALREGARQPGHVALMRMDAARREQAEQVDGPRAGAHLLRDGVDLPRALQLAGFEQPVDARQVLEHHPAGAEVHVADLGITHLAFRQTDGGTVGAQQAARQGSPAAVEDRGVRERHRIVARVLAAAPAVEDAQHHRSRAPTPHAGPGRQAHGISSSMADLRPSPRMWSS
ncbi:hypothetical protein HRbin39_01732 [bacterium HR39]|nr:hypothetical protein HRbin39_01732 [bacterium HR39]